MSEEKNKVHGVSRRSFITAMAAAAGTAALAGSFVGCTPGPTEGPDHPIEKPAPPEEQIHQGVCRGNCGGGCRMNVHVRDGKVVKTSVIKEDDPVFTRICPRGLAQTQRIYAPERLQYPMRRKDGTARGAGEWERITWDEAIEYITSKWKTYIQEAGAPSVSYSFGAGTYALDQYIYMRLFNCLGGTNFGQEYDMGALEQGWSMYGMSTFLCGNHSGDVMNAKYIFSWGHNVTTSSVNHWVFMLEAKKNHDAKFIVIDPVYTDIAAKADIWVPIKAGTDGALALAMINYIITNGKTDDAYMAKHTVAPFLVKPDGYTYLKASDLGVSPQEGPISPTTGMPTVIDPIICMGTDGKEGPVDEISDPVITGTFTINGIEVRTSYDLLKDRVAEWTLEKAAEICQIEVDTIKELSDLYCEGPSTLFLGFGNDHWGNGQSITHGQFTLPLISGQIAKPGTGIGGHQGGDGSGYAGANMAAAVFPEGAIGGFSLTLLYLPMIMDTGFYGEIPLNIKSMFIYCSNPLASHAGRNKLIAALDKVELIIYADTIMNDTARYADVVLPVPHWFEWETAIAYPVPNCEFNAAAVPPQFECKTDIEICALLGASMGYPQMDLTTDSYFEMLLDTDIAREAGLTWEVLKTEKAIRIRPAEYLYGGDENPFVSVTGRGQFFLEDPTPKFNYGQPLDKKLLALPFYQEPLEAYDSNPLKEQYPIIMGTHRDKFKVHTAFAPSPWLMEIQPEPTIEINPADAEARGIADGDYARCFNDRGSCVFRAYHDASMPPGFIWTEHTWLDNQYKEGVYSELTSMATTHFKPTNSPFDTLVQVEKA